MCFMNKWSPIDVIALEDAAEQAIFSNENVLVIAGPGSGKSELLAQKAHYIFTTGKLHLSKRILAISFKKDAAKNIYDRVNLRCPNYAARFDSKTFDSFAKLLIDRFGQSLPEVWRPRRDFSIRTAFSKDEASEWLLSHGITPDARPFDPQLSFAVLSHGTSLPINSLQKWPNGVSFARVLWKEVLAQPTDQPSLTFPMLNRLAAFLLRTNSKVLAALRATYPYVFIDEFQDTTESQYDLIYSAFSNSSSIITAVGDSKQRIMLWAGAMKEVFSTFMRDFTPKTIYLKNNYRSAPELVEMQNIISRVLEDDSYFCSSQKSNITGTCKIIEFSTQEDEAKYISNYINEKLVYENYNIRDFCVITRQRTSEMISSLKYMLTKDYNIKIRDEGLIQDLLAEPIVLLLISILSLLINKRSPQDYLYIRKELFSYWYDNLYYSDIDYFFKNIFLNCSDINKENFIDKLEAILDIIGKDKIKSRYKQYMHGKFLDTTIHSFYEVINVYINKECTIKDALVDFIGKNCIPAMTIHKSKGLEFKTVIFLGLEDGQWWNFRKQADEEKRAFFVAFSRAIENVIFTYSDIRESKRGREVQTKNNTEALYKLLVDAGVPVIDMRS